ncbi:MAG: DsbA family oxidoreductase [Alphaproteobacteria bacterium]|nr:DsbA family oxidoreductase [Alphaproteobacteria bacterium]
MNIKVFFDPICPWCFLGKRRLERALELRPAIQATITWRPFMLNPDMPAGGMEREAYLLHKFGSQTRVRRLLGALELMGASEEIPFSFHRIVQTPSTVGAHRLVHYAEDFGRDGAVIDTLFRAYFQDGRDIGSIDILSEIGRESGLDGGPLDAFLDSETDTEWVYKENTRAHRLGVNGVPCFLFDGELALQGAQPPAILTRMLDAAASLAA